MADVSQAPVANAQEEEEDPTNGPSMDTATTTTLEASSTAAAAVTTTTAVVNPRPTKRGKRANSPMMDAVTRAAFVQASALLHIQGIHGVASLLEQKEFPTLASTQTAARKAVSEQSPPWVCFNKADMAPFKTLSRRLGLVNGMRGYRMARASHGTSSGAWYYECYLESMPEDLQALLPANARLGADLLKQLESAIRVGWSMRTGDLQAPVGYDKWSYGIRNRGGGIIHDSKRQDTWGGENFGVGDVIGCAIVLQEDDNHIRFFKNGECLGKFVMERGKRHGGEAFVDIEPGTYYPAVSMYLAGTLRANFGPHWIYPPRRRLPLGLANKLRPVSDLCSEPKSPDDAVQACSAAWKLFKGEQQEKLKEAIHAEAVILLEAHAEFREAHRAEIRQARLDRNLSVDDLGDDDDAVMCSPTAETS